MLALKSQGKIVERVVRTKTGEQVLAMFLVVEENGELKVQLLSVKPILKVTGTKSPTVCLSGNCLKSPAIVSYRHNYHSVVSPFFNLFEFFVSQPTRAPSFGF